jgi:Arc/MetJ-type ribon-helix-helix transcriptional regulator
MKEKEKNQSSEKKERTKKHKDALEDIGNQVERIAAKTAESLKKVWDKTLSSRNTVLTIRVDDDSNDKMNMLVESGIFKSRSESAAFLIKEGIQKQEPLFSKISSKLEKIEKIRAELAGIVASEMETEKKGSETP